MECAEGSPPPAQSLSSRSSAGVPTNGAKGVYVQVELEGQEAVTMAKPLKSDCIQWNEELMLSKLRRRSFLPFVGGWHFCSRLPG